MDNLWTYAGIAGAALIGTLARFGKWHTPDGKFDGQKAMAELLSAPAIGLIAGGICRLINPIMDPLIVGLLAVCFGVIGIATLETIIVKVLNRKADGI